MGRFDLNDEEWRIIAPLLPKGTRGPKRSPADDRRILNAIFYILRTSAPWADLPGRYGPYKTAYNRYNRWAKRGIWGEMFEALAASCKDSLIFIDSTIVKAHRASAGALKKGAYWANISAAHAAVAQVRFMRP
ncbi:hypothetical protein MNBD_ALPHA03-493 [hydrothermal vent metagenome]|uniref:Insertion element IS402-like domain-containing protein n=1 Tax=hydrothermal vent metagenome TaxID=652676 RepID=A0A3B1AW34_9ZZZZ